MKRVIATAFRNQNYIEVVINIDYVEDRILEVAASTVQHPENIKKRKRLSDLKLGVLNDIVEGVISCVKHYQFPILESYQSKRSYSYYLTFQPIDKKGNRSTPIPIKFRVGDIHKRQLDTAQPRRIFIVSVTMGDYLFDNRFQFQLDFDYMCSQLAEGELSSMDILEQYK